MLSVSVAEVISLLTPGAQEYGALKDTAPRNPDISHTHKL